MVTNCLSVCHIAHGNLSSPISGTQRDPVGNIIQESGVMTGPGTDPIKGVRISPATASVNSLNQFITSGNDTCTYDTDGNLTEVRGSRDFIARYDPENRPIEITRDGKKTFYEYGAAGPGPGRYAMGL